MNCIDGNMVKNNMVRIKISCPDKIAGCAVLHYKWIPLVKYYNGTKF